MIKWKSILQRVTGVFRKTSGAMTVIEDQAGVSEYTAALDIPEATEATIQDIKDLITQNPWSAVSGSPEINLLEETNGHKHLVVKFNVISIAKGRLIEEEIKSFLLSRKY